MQEKYVKIQCWKNQTPTVSQSQGE